ncbi:MAG: tyrosine-protein phosphatase, partial [Bdellovibrionales bacterium]|nr:tyrosine-protein phosphatase [Bdellovibrionales bacterium]
MSNRIWIFAIVILSLTGVIVRISSFRPLRNFHEIDPGKFYRSAQLTPEELRQITKMYGIRTVINLRGRQTGKSWYENQKSTLNEMGVPQVDIAFDSDTVPQRVRLMRYLNTLKNSERPILIHCRSGADRTGLSSAIYMYDYMGASKEEAETQMSSDYLHLENFKPAKKHFFDHYKGYDWAKNEY